jgi:D-alanyl-D-alanine dipeptidase
MRRFLFLMFIGVVVWAQTLPPKTKQLIVVTTDGWNDNSGILQRYEKNNGIWYKKGGAIRVRLGRNGLGWGIGLHTVPADAHYIKKEGDGRSPAGIFELKQAFGYAPLKGVRYPYSVYDEKHHCVDDVRSRYYNRIVDSRHIKRDYASFEHMKFPKDYYKYGIVVNHNHIDEKGAVAGAGSCIFLHIKNVPTAGCTVMNEREIVMLIRWLDEKRFPLLVQGTKQEVNRLLKKEKFKD